MPRLRIVTLALVFECATLLFPVTMPAAALAQGTSPTPPRAWGAFDQTWAGIAGYSATITVYERKGTAEETVVFDYSFHKPSVSTVHVVKGPNAGATIVWGGGDTVVAHRGSGMQAMFKKTFTLHDPIVETIRGSSVDQLSFASILSHAQATPGMVSEVPGPTIDGVPTEAVSVVPASSSADAGLTLETVDVSSTTNLPVRALAYDGTTLVRQVDFSSIKLQPV